jgi:hypothetical protein
VFTNQRGNTVAGDLISGSKTENTFNLINSSSIEEISLLYAKIKENGFGEPSGGSFCEQLEHYMAARADGDVRGLEVKLMESGRTDQLEQATELKERAAKAVMRYQTSRTAQRIYTIILDELHTNFMLIVTPAIQDGAARREVDQCIQQILQSTKSVLGENLLQFTVKDLLGLLYYLGGNCHIRWDKC